MKSKILILILFVFIFLYISNLNSQYISSTKHNLSVSGSGTIKASSESQICIFCHTPHNSSPKTPLWNRHDPGSTFTLYHSSTIKATMGQPDGTSLMCLSCHDGTIAIGNTYNRATDFIMAGGITTLPSSGRSNISTDLSDDHPISFTYDNILAALNVHIKSPSQIDSKTKLDNNSKMQCTSCHDPHKNVSSYFLVLTNENSSLCLSCHNLSGWTSSTHKSSTKTWNGSGTNPWKHTSYNTVAKNACESCHNPHLAGGKSRLLNYSTEETNCLNCHNGNASSTDIKTQLIKAYRHDVANYNGIHDPTEESSIATQHVVCVDCHNPHKSNNSSADPPNVRGALSGVKGINSDGNSVDEANYEYEICYKCHAGQSWSPGSPTTRAISQNNTRLEFDEGNPSYHPVEAAGRNSNVPSLLTGYSTTSLIYCSSCHASNGTNVPKGPHGSSYLRILKYNYTRTDNSSESATAYELCYSCHSRTSILEDESFRYHNLHIREERTPCNVCHDPHGISATQGNSTNNAHLINFDANVVTTYNGTRRFEDLGTYTGRCTLRCHGENHNNFRY